MSTQSSDTAVVERAVAQAGKYLTFHLAGEIQGIEILKVQEIIGIMEVTHVPQMPEFVRGVINLRGQVIPVVDLRLKLALPPQADTEKTCVIVVQVECATGRNTMGLIVDEVAEVADLNANQIEPAPAFGSNVHTEFILGMAKIGDRVVILIDIDRVLSTDEIAAMSQAK